MNLELLPGTFAVCQLSSPDAIDLRPFTFLSVTDDEISLVCPEQNAPAALHTEPGWRALRVCGTLDFSLTGVLSTMASALSEAGISIFAVSTYNTDYVLVKEHMLSRAIAALKSAGYQMEAVKAE